MNNEKKITKLVDEILKEVGEEKKIDIGAVLCLYQEQREKIVDHIVLCLEKNKIAKEINCKSIIKPLAYSLISLNFIIIYANLTYEEMDKIYSTIIWFDKEQIKTTKNKLKFCMHLISDIEIAEHKNLFNILELFNSNGCSFTNSSIDRGSLILSISKLYAILELICGFFNVNIKLLNYISSYLKELETQEMNADELIDAEI